MNAVRWKLRPLGRRGSLELKYLAAKYGFEEVIWERKKA